MRKVVVFLAGVATLALSLGFLFSKTEKQISASTDAREAFAALTPQSGQAAKFAETEPLSEILARQQKQPRAKNFSLTEIRKQSDNVVPPREAPGAVHDSDAAIAENSGLEMPSPSLSFDGMNNIDNGLEHGILVIPPDTNGDVGPNHYVQSMNILLRVFDKQGAPMSPPFRMSNLFSTLGTPCAARDDGEPTVLYDQLADRWLMSQYCNLAPPFRQMVAVSKTGDPLGSYYVYEFIMPNFKQNDVTKFGIWPNAYFASCDLFLGSDYVGAGAFAFDRTRLLRGDPLASFIYFELPVAATQTRTGGLLPADIDGLTTPPANISGLFMGYTATEYGDAQDALRLFELKPDFARPLQSTFQELATSPIAVAAFNPTSPPGRADIFQPAPGEMLDSNSDRLMYRLSYRNFGDRESLVVNQTVRTTPFEQNFHAGVRVYELSRPNPAAPFVPNVQNTLVGPGENRWIGSAAQDHQGNLAVGYNTGNVALNPSIYYTGRLATDPPNTLRNESKLMDGTGVQTAFGFRWGDYTNMTVDPVDDCTFWYNNQYYTEASQAESPFGWVTRIGKFKFPECTNAPRGTIQGTVTNSVTGQPIQNIVVELNTSFSRTTNAAGQYNALLVPGNYKIRVFAPGYTPFTTDVNLSNGATVTQNISLTPRPFIASDSINITSESCATNFAIEPGETVTISLPLRNTGATDANDLTVTLHPFNGITNPSAPQNYGTLAAGGPTVLRSFTFTVSSGLPCGSQLAMGFTYQTVSPITSGSFDVIRTAGAPRFIMQEPFAGPGTTFPAGWTTSITGDVFPWEKVLHEPTQNDYSAFSPEAVRIGVNEFVSPPVAVTNGNATLSFRNKYDLESTFLRNRLYDGGVLEIKIGSGQFQDILAAGGIFLSGGYVGTIDACCQNPLAGRLGWSSKSGLNTEAEWINTTVQLPPSVAGQNVQFRWRVGTDVGGRRTGQWIDNVEVQDGATCSCSISVPLPPRFDFDGDGRTDLSTYHPTNDAGADFSYRRSSTGDTVQVSWGGIGDLAAAADYTGDRKADIAVFRPSLGAWYILDSQNGTVQIASFGVAGDITVPEDYDGDGKADIAVYRPSTGVWYAAKSSDGQFLIGQFGLNGDVPVQGDYDGDGKADFGVWRPSNGVWYILGSLSGVQITPFGLNGDIPVPGDYDGDGKYDLVVMRPSTGTWYLNRSQLGFTAVAFGLATDRPLQADLDGDGKDDIAVYRPSTNTWFHLRSSDGAFVATQFGNSGDTAVPSIYIP